MADADFSWEAPQNRFLPPGTEAGSQKLSDEVLVGNARWFIVFRWVTIGALFLFQILAIIFSDILTQIGITHQQGWPVSVIIVLVAANVIYIYALDSRRSTKYNSPSINIWCQIIIDLICLSIVVHYVGSIATPAPFFYVLHIALSCIFFSTRESLIVTLLVCTMYTIMLLIENSMFYQLFLEVPADPHAVPGEMIESKALLWMFTLNTLFIVVWYVVSRLTIVVRTHERDLVGAYERITVGQVEKDQYAVLMTHQLKAPLDAIRSKINLIKGGYCGETSAEIKDVLLKIDNRASGMASLIMDVLRLERLKAAARSINTRENVSIKSVIIRCIDKLMTLSDSRKIKVSVSMQDFLAEGIPDQFEILFENIILNAIVYSHDGASVEIASAIDKQNSSATVMIVDHGIGIADKDLPHIFDEYFYTPKAVLHNRASSGIGLSIVKTVAENNKLHIKVSSESNVGTTFFITFYGVNLNASDTGPDQDPTVSIRPQ